MFPQVLTPLFSTTTESVALSLDFMWDGAPASTDFVLARGDGAHTGIVVSLMSYEP